MLRWIPNHRNMLDRELAKAERNYERAIRDNIGDPEPGDLQHDLAKQYSKLYNLDYFSSSLSSFSSFFIIIISLFVAYCV